jgi:pimeloyl-ACP methyl ester carboxylesterase
VASGICWRATPSPPRAVLIHGLGIGTRYFRRFARALHERGIASVAPDLPGIGFSEERRPYDHAAVARALLEWAASAGIGNPVWIGHSTGCQIVEAVRRLAPSLPAAIHIAPIWTRRRWPWVRLPALLALDGLREPWGLIAEAARAYWDAGGIRIVTHAAAARRDLDCPVTPQQALAIAGRRDALVDRARLAALKVPVREIDGGHGIVWTNPEEIAELAREFLA